MDTTLFLTGMLPVIVLASAGLTALASLFLLKLYRRAVLRSMGAQAPASARLPNPHVKTIKKSAGELPLAISPKSTENKEVTDLADSNQLRATRSIRNVTLLYILGGLAYALILVLPWMLIADGGFVLARFLWLVLCYSWPVALAVGLIAATGNEDRLIIAGVYFAVLIAIAAAALAKNPSLDPIQLVFFWLFANAPGTVLLLTFLHRKVRAVGPMVLAFMVAGVTGAFVSVQAAGSDDRLLRQIVEIGSMLGLDAKGIFILLFIVGFALFGILGFLLLRRIGCEYLEKRMSDQSINLDAMWLMFGVVQSIPLAFESWAWTFAGLAAFLVYKLVVKAGFAFFIRPDRKNAKAPMLLLLRVFSLGSRSERLFDSISKWWLRAGGICLIAGPDLITNTVEPHEFLDFMGGRLSRQFVQSEADLNERLKRIDKKSDPDGRFRVNEFFCHADTWQMTMKRLASISDVVLMDLRSFSKSNQGCLFELEQLLAAIPLESVLFVIDDTTDRPFLERTFKSLWQNIPAGSPNSKSAVNELRLFKASSQSAKETRKLLRTLFAASDHSPAILQSQA